MAHRGVLAACILVALACRAPAAAQEEGLAGYWRFDEASGSKALDCSGHGHHGAIKGDLQRGPGRVGQALYFKAEKGAGVVIPPAPDLGPTSALTLEAWVKPEQLVREETYDIINKAGDRGPGYRLFFSWAALRMRSGGGFGKDFWEIAASVVVNPFTAGLWHHVAATYDGQVYRLFLNGIEVAAGGTLFHDNATLPLDGSAHPVTVSEHPVTIGAYLAGYAYPFHGAIDEVKIYGRAKTAEEVFRAAKEL